MCGYEVGEVWDWGNEVVPCHGRVLVLPCSCFFSLSRDQSCTIPTKVGQTSCSCPCPS